MKRAGAWRTRLDRTEHLALYTAFHRGHGNKMAHGILVPVIFFSALCLLSYVPVRVAGLPGSLSAAVVLSMLLVVLLAIIDLTGAVLLGALLAPGCVAAAAVDAAAAPWIVAPVAALGHLAGWYGTVVVGHEKLEPQLRVGASIEDSNLYFRRGYYLARALGREVSWLDRGIQFCIAPLAVVQDGLEALRLRHGLRDQVATARSALLDRLERGEAPFEARSATRPRAPSFSAGGPRSASPPTA